MIRCCLKNLTHQANPWSPSTFSASNQIPIGHVLMELLKIFLPEVRDFFQISVIVVVVVSRDSPPCSMTMNAVPTNIGCSTRAIRHFRLRFHATGRKEDPPRSGRQRVTTRGQARYIRNTHQRNRFQTATATAANNHGTHNNRISAQTVRNCLSEGGLCARRPYVCCVLARRHRVN